MLSFQDFPNSGLRSSRVSVLGLFTLVWFLWAFCFLILLLTFRSFVFLILLWCFRTLVFLIFLCSLGFLWSLSRFVLFRSLGFLCFFTRFFGSSLGTGYNWAGCNNGFLSNDNRCSTRITKDRALMSQFWENWDMNCINSKLFGK